MSRWDVTETIVRPMQRVYLPPRHLRHHDPEDLEAKQEALEQYYHALESFARDTVENAWRRVRAKHEFSIWPTPAKVVQAANQFVPKPLPPSEAEQKRQQAWKRAKEYTDRFMQRRQL